MYGGGRSRGSDLTSGMMYGEERVLEVVDKNTQVREEGGVRWSTLAQEICCCCCRPSDVLMPARV